MLHHWKWLLALKWSKQEGKYQSTSSNGLMRESISQWHGYMLKWKTKTNPSCQRFGMLFVESTRLEYVDSKTSLRHGLMVSLTIRWAIPLTTSIVNSTNRPWCLFKDQVKSKHRPITSYSFITQSLLSPEMDTGVREWVKKKFEVSAVLAKEHTYTLKL